MSITLTFKLGFIIIALICTANFIDSQCIYFPLCYFLKALGQWMPFLVKTLHIHALLIQFRSQWSIWHNKILEKILSEPKKNMSILGQSGKVGTSHII